MKASTGLTQEPTDALKDGRTGKTPSLTWPWRHLLVLVGLGAAGFHLAFAFSASAWLVILLPFALIGLSRSPRWRMAFYPALLLGLLCYAPRLAFFWTIFGFGAVALWLVLAVWLGFFAVGLRWLQHRLVVGRASAPDQPVLLNEAAEYALAKQGCPAYGSWWLLLLAPVLWTALEFFRSELYWLRFAWFAPGMAFDQWPGVVSTVGSYGIGFAAAFLAAIAWLTIDRMAKAGRDGSPSRPQLQAESARAQRASRDESIRTPETLTSFASLRSDQGRLGEPSLPRLFRTTTPGLRTAVMLVVLAFALHGAVAKSVQIAGAQLEFPTHDDVLKTLDGIVAKHPKTELIVLGEYTFDDAPPKSVLKWCRDHRRHLIVGGKDPLPDGNFYNTAFVVSPDGAIVFKQAKKQPIQFFKDGRPALRQQLWISPWGPIGIAICYDFSYSRIIDELVRQGAQALIIPTMDLVEWGEAQHATHARLGPIRAAEYGLPVVRVCTSGESQIISSKGQVERSLPFDGQGAIFASTLTLDRAGRLPPDRWLVRGCVVATALLFLIGCLRPLRPKPDTSTLSSKPLSAP